MGAVDVEGYDAGSSAVGRPGSDGQFCASVLCGDEEPEQLRSVVGQVSRRLTEECAQGSVGVAFEEEGAEGAAS